jgi:hypothetical protein
MAKAPKAEPTLEELAHAQALRDVAIELRAIDDTIDYLESIRALKRANIRAELEARGLRSSETIVRGMKAALSPFDHRLHVPRARSEGMRERRGTTCRRVRDARERRLLERDLRRPHSGEDGAQSTARLLPAGQMRRGPGLWARADNVSSSKGRWTGEGLPTKIRFKVE